MVNRQHVLLILLFFSVPIFFFAHVPHQDAWAQGVQFHVEKEWVKIWINPDGTIDLQYTLRVICDRGSFSYVFFDQPVGDFKIGDAFDADGHALRIEDASQNSDFKVKVYLNQPVTAGQAAEFSATTNVGHMIWEDQTNTGNVGLQFVPTTWPSASGLIGDLRILVVLPTGLTKDQVRVTPNWDNAYTDPDENGRLVVYWERKDLDTTTKFQVGVSLPKNYVQHYETAKPTGGSSYLVLPIASISLIFLIGLGFAVKHFGPRTYVDPRMQMETLGIRRGLTAVESSYLLGVTPIRVIVMILYGLFLKRAVWVRSTQPSLAIQVLEDFKQQGASPETTLRYYEIDFVQAIKTDGTLEERTLAKAFMDVRSTVESKLKGYCRADTLAFYQKTIQQAWEEVEKAGTSELASKLFDQNLLWLMLDDKFGSRTETAFRTVDFTPQPIWWWYWYGNTHYDANPSYNPVTSQGQPPPKIPGSEFANNIATSIEKSASNIVVSMEKFANSILPAPPPSQNVSSKPVHHDANCACACVSCACVCACVSCACACASGGGVG